MSPETQYKELLVVRKNPDKVKLLFANDFLASHTENAFYFVFSIIEPPTMVMSKEEIDSLTSIEAVAVLRAVVPPDVAKKIVAALSANLKTYEEKFGSIETD